jgi:peroxiredoxin Q/BCP
MKVWKLKKFMGREYMGVERSTFLIKDGKIIEAWQPVKVAGHVKAVIDAWKEFK